MVFSKDELAGLNAQKHSGTDMQKFSNTIRLIVFFNQSSNGLRRSNSFRSSSDLENSFTIPNLFRLSKPFLSRFVFIVIDNTLNLATVLQVFLRTYFISPYSAQP